MSHPAQREFCRKVKRLYPKFFKKVNVLDIGSQDINGSNKGLFTRSFYLGIDIQEGKNVDVVGKAHEVIWNLEPMIEPSYVWNWKKTRIENDKRFNTIICTEVLEHDQDYEKTMTAMYNKLKPGGLIIITCGGDGRPEHGTEDNSPDASPMTNEYYGNLSNKMFSDVYPPFGFRIYHLAQVDTDLQFFGIKT